MGEIHEDGHGPSGQDSAKATAPAAKRKRAIANGVVAAVIVAAIGGFAVWHEQPTFCNAICHTPMNSYVESYYNDDGTQLAHVHKLAGKSCLDCHPAKLDQQIKEAGHWVTGDYAFDEASGNLVPRSEEFATQEFCLNESCHNMDLDQLREKTSSMAWNPHDFTEHGVTECGSCHKMHDQSVMVCSECHYQAAENVPEGWASIPYRQEK